MLGGLGFWEVVVILAVVLLVFGPHKLPEFARTVGRALGEFRRAGNDLRRAVEEQALAPEPPARDGPPAGYGAPAEPPAAAADPPLPPASRRDGGGNGNGVTLGRIALKRNAVSEAGGAAAPGPAAPAAGPTPPEGEAAGEPEGR